MWHKTIISTLSVMIFLILSQYTVSAQSTTLYETTVTEPIAKGLTYEHRSKLTNNGWVDIHVLKMDLKEPTLELDVIRDQERFAGLTKLSVMGNQNTKFVGGINASFFSTGYVLSDAEGYEYDDQQYSFVRDNANSPYYRNASLLEMMDGTLRMGFIQTNIELKTSTGGIIYILGVNSISDLKNPMIFNRKAYMDSSKIDQIDKVYKLVVESNVITAIKMPTEVAVIPENGYIVTFHETHAESILKSVRVGLGLSLDVQTNVDEAQLKLAISGGGLILKDGLVIQEGLVVGANKRHPRTAVGRTADGQYMIAMVVDGRGESIGATHNELAAYLKEYKVDLAMHMDGGGSSTLATKSLGALVLSAKNTPSDGQERPVVNGLGIVSNAPTTDTTNLQLKVASQRVFINATVKLQLVAFDDNFNAIAVDPSRVAWSLGGGYGTIDQKNLTFTPLVAGEVVLTAQYLGQQTQLTLTVVDKLIDIQITPKVVYFEDGITEFKVTGIDTEGYKVSLNNNMLTWSMDPTFGTVTNGVFVGKPSDQVATIDVTYQDVKEVAYATTVSLITSDVDLSGLGISSLVYPSFVVGEAKKVTSEFGTSLQLDYQFVKSDVSQAVYAQFDDFILSNPVDKLEVVTTPLPNDLLLKAYIEDQFGETISLTFKGTSGQLVATLPTTLSYPLKVKRLYVVTLPRETPIIGSISIQSIRKTTRAKAIDEINLLDYPPKDALYQVYPTSGYSVKVFGATSGRNRLLDRVLMDKVYTELNTANYAVYAGSSSVEAAKVTTNALVYGDAYKVVDLKDLRVVTLGMSEGSMVRTDSTQWTKFNSMLSGTLQNSIIILGTESLVNNTDKSFTKEGKLIHDTMSAYVKKSGKTVFYVNASGYGSGLSYYEGIRYIDLNGLWYNVEDNHSVDLYDSFKVLNFNVVNGQVSYQISDLYPKTNITN